MKKHLMQSTALSAPAGDESRDRGSGARRTGQIGAAAMLAVMLAASPLAFDGAMPLVTSPQALADGDGRGSEFWTRGDSPRHGGGERGDNGRHLGWWYGERGDPGRCDDRNERGECGEAGQNAWWNEKGEGGENDRDWWDENGENGERGDDERGESGERGEGGESAWWEN